MPCQKIFFSLLVCSLIVISPVILAQSVAITIDDGPQLNETPLLSPQQRNKALLAALAKHGAKAALFVTVNNGANRPEGLALLRAWSEAGHAIGNHTITHLNLHNEKVTLQQYQQEIQDCDALIRQLPGYQKWFRFTYLREGNTPEKRDGMRAFLKEQGYRNAHVTLDTSDWRLNQKLIEVLQRDINADITPIKRTYLSHVWQRAQAYRDLSQRLQGRDIPQVLLLHHNLINALWLDDVLAMFIQKGWTLTSPANAYADLVYQLQPELSVSGQSLLIAMARSLGLWDPQGVKIDGWARLIDDGEYEINQLKVVGF
jgi:peptidoglycan-N-acetylglucosamine deacetylase